DHDKERIENPDAHHGGFVRERLTRNVRVSDLDNGQANAKADRGRFSRERHHVSRQVEDDSAGKQRDFQCKLWIAIIPRAKSDFPSVVVDRQIARMSNEIEDPMRKNSHAHNQGSRLYVRVTEPTAK